MNVLLIGSGGREHALAWAMSSSPLLTNLYAAPGNGGICQIAQCLPLDIMDHAAIIQACKDHNMDLVVVGPEAPLVAGLADALEAADIPTFGPKQAAAELEGSKAFTKALCLEAGIPTAAYGTFTDEADALAYLENCPLPVVIKADGLAAGKGVTIADDISTAKAAIADIFAGAYGEKIVVVEEFLVGEEASFFALSDGKSVLPLASAQDHKRAFDGDEGPNTGGMGAYSPAPVMTDEIFAQTMDQIITPTIETMAQRGTPFRGVLFAGLMITEDGPKLIEYNVRFGDPECQVLMMRLKDDFLTLIKAVMDANLNTTTVEWFDDTALCVVMATKGYPGAYQNGSEIRKLDEAGAMEGIEIFHAATERDGDHYIAKGGRVLNIAALGGTVEQAQANVYDAISRIDWPEGFYRHDIGWQAIARQTNLD